MKILLKDFDQIERWTIKPRKILVIRAYLVAYSYWHSISGPSLAQYPAISKHPKVVNVL